MTLEIREITQKGTELEEITSLFREYNDFLGFDLCFQNFAEELAALPGKYAPPSGRLYLVKYGGNTAGCAAFYKLGEGVCELKRLYLRPGFQGRGLGRAVMQRAMADAKAAGYDRMRLDSLRRLKEARALYEKFGFTEIQPYNYNPFDDVYYMERAL